ncbi:hypothetical protein EJ04DRAFT_489010 [Polyplosphaeria fusca]|uniref:S-adenosyl-L-methionine-dependent methyltransferase n=1 Tax=Polyplosphaeria fusca TaxID=682080 RepID=A0A9P4V516_9PLEO|nr:hypothetical protein EJ04DRAFT_489010 [Polyplosphaeria fusca]
MLDYACGGGFLSKIFAPYISSITAIDITPSMISRYNLSRTNGAITPEKSSAMVGNLLSSPPDPASLADKQFYDFDLITVGAALHHFPSSADALRILAARLAPDGVLLIQDLFDARTPDSDGELPPEPKNRPTGFAKQGLGSMMESAGLQDFRMEVFAETFKIELPSLEVMEFQCFVASAKKPV